MLKSAFMLNVGLLTALYGYSTSAQVISQQERDAWNAARMLNSRAAYQSFLETYPSSPYASEAMSSMVQGVDRSLDGGSGGSGGGESY